MTFLSFLVFSVSFPHREFPVHVLPTVAGSLVRQLSQGVGGDPAGGGGADFPDFAGGLHRKGIKRKVPLADLAKGPVDGLLYEIAVVARLTDDQGGGIRKEGVIRY